MPQFLSTAEDGFESRFAAFLGAKREADADVDADVAAILADVAARGDAAVIEMTARWDRLALTPATLAFTAAEIDAAVAAVAPADRAALELAADRIRAYHERQLPPDARWTDAAGAELGWRWTAGRLGGALRARRPRLVSVVGADERDPGAGRGRGAAGDLRPDPGRRGQPAGAARSKARRGGDGLPDRRRAGDRGARLRHRHHRAGRQDHRSGQRLGGGGQAPGVRPRRHRHDRRPLGDPGDRRRGQRSRLDRARPPEPGRARRGGPGDPRHRRRRLRPRRRRGGRSAGSRPSPAAPSPPRAGATSAR